MTGAENQIILSLILSISNLFVLFLFKQFFLGTGTVIVRLSDLNDNSPRLSRREWNVALDESDGNFSQDDSTLFEMTVDDPDASNYFLFRVGKPSNIFLKKFSEGLCVGFELDVKLDNL